MSEYQIVAAGIHPAILRSAQFCHTERDNKEQVALGFEIQNWNEEQTNEDAGKTLTYFGQFGEAQPGKTKGPWDFTVEALRNCGWTGDELVEVPDLAAAGQLSQLVWLVVEHEEYEGKLREKIKWVNRPGGNTYKPKKPMDAQTLKQFSAGMKSRLRATATKAAPAQPTRPAGNGAQRPPQRHPNAPGGIDDDIPFASSSIDAEPSPIAKVVR